MPGQRRAAAPRRVRRHDDDEELYLMFHTWNNFKQNNADPGYYELEAKDGDSVTTGNFSFAPCTWTLAASAQKSRQPVSSVQARAPAERTLTLAES